MAVRLPLWLHPALLDLADRQLYEQLRHQMMLAVVRELASAVKFAATPIITDASSATAATPTRTRDLTDLK